MTDNRVRSLSFSSETPVERWFGNEVLDHSPKSVRMDFFRSGRAPLLRDHDQRQIIGVVQKAAIGKDKMGRADVRFSRSAAGNDAMAEADDGILTNTSVGYRVHGMTLADTHDGIDTYRVDDWEPLEASLVGIPADPSVGLGRSADATITREEIESAPIATSSVDSNISASLAGLQRAENRETLSATTPSQRRAEEPTMEQVTSSPAAPAASITAIEAEKERRATIIELCKQAKIDARVESRWITEGVPLTQVGIELAQVLEERGKHKPTAMSDLGLSRSETQRYSLFKAIRVLHYGGRERSYVEAAGFELECSRALAKQLGREVGTNILIPGEVLSRPMAPDVMGRAMSAQPGSKGGYMVGVENMGFLEILRNRSVAMSMGARQLSGLTGNVMFPRQTGKATVTWQGGEGASVTASDQALGQLSMTPKTAIAITDVSEQLLRQASPSAEQFVMADLAADIAIDGVDYVAINGTGGAQPIGIKNTSGVTTGQDAASATYAKILAFVSTAGALNAIRGNPGFVTTTAGAAKLMTVQRFSSTDTPVWEGNMLDGQLVKFKAMSSEQLGSGNLIFGSWDELVIGDWGVLELSTDNGGTRFNQAQVGVRAMWMVDVMLRYPQAFVVSTNLS